ncbi:hypothetical protein BGZ92_003719 [Podila epicladia]|nr:hypothetical protein BGZ92_003719 [Podila epicladia]
MADIVVYDDSPLAQYLLEIQGDQPDTELQHITVPVTEPGPAPESLGSRIANNAADFLASLLEYLTLTFSASSSENDDTQFEERFKYFICTSPFLNKNVTVQAHERGRREMTSLEFSTSMFHPGPFGYVLGVGTLATIITRSALVRTRIARMPVIRPMLSRSAAVSLALASSLWMLRILQRRNTQTTQNQALRSLQLLISQCQALDAKVNRAIMVIQEIELVSRGYRLSTPLAPISRIEQASKTRRCNLVRAQLVTALVTSGALFQKSTETLQSHIDQKRLSTLLDMYNITPSSGPNSPAVFQGAPHDTIAWTASPTIEGNPMLPSTTARRNSMTHRRSRTMTGGSISRSRSRPASRPSSFHETFNGPHPSVINEEHHRFINSTTPSGIRRRVRHSTSWSASEGEDSDPELYRISPRSSGYSNSPITAPEMTTLEKLRKNFQKMHGYRREFLCELLSIRRKTRRGRQGAKDYDKNWAVVRDVLQEGVSGLEAVVNELNKALDAELYTLPRIDTRKTTSDNPTQDKQLQPFVHRLALLEQHVRGVQAKLYICNEDIRETIQEDPTDPEKRKLLELQFDSISQDISMMASEWQQGKAALMNVFDPPVHTTLPMLEEASPNLDDDVGEDDSVFSGTVVDSMEHLEDQNGLKTLASKREEVFEGSTEDSFGSEFGRRGMVGTKGGVKMTRAERIQQQKQLREQEEAKKERSRDSSRMVHELKDVLGRRRHMRENDDEPESPTPASTTSTTSTTSTVRATFSPLLVSKTISYEQFFQAHESASLNVEHEEFVSQVMEEVTPFTLDSPTE